MHFGIITVMCSDQRVPLKIDDIMTKFKAPIKKYYFVRLMREILPPQQLTAEQPHEDLPMEQDH